MRKDIKASEARLCKALTMLGYAKIGAHEWRRLQFHLSIRNKGKRKIALSIHEDVPSKLPPFHRARRASKSLEVELGKILNAYRELRPA